MLTGSIGSVVGFLAFNYPTFQSDGVGGIVYDVIRVVSWALLACAAVAMGLRLFRTRITL